MMITESERTILRAAQNICRELDTRYQALAYHPDAEHLSAGRFGRIAGSFGAASESLSNALIALSVYGPNAEQPADAEQVTA